ncbi:hypothetical protein J7U39_30450 (plasmid) [Rhizobium sp. NLR16a]|nr:hypothetical protein J7U39_30450 [Rhizobium sp. NLR16a]
MGVKPPIRTHGGIAVAKAQIFNAEPLLAFDFVLKEGMVERAAHLMDAAEQFPQNISLFLVARPIAAFHDCRDGLAQCLQRIALRRAVDDHIETFPAEADVYAASERIDDVSDLDPIFVERGAVSRDAAIAPDALRIWNDGHAPTIERRPFKQVVRMDRYVIRRDAQWSRNASQKSMASPTVISLSEKRPSMVKWRR